MPELPEVETWRRALQSWVGGQRLMGIELVDRAVVRPRLSTRPSEASAAGQAQLDALVGERLTRLRRVGKRLGLSFEEHHLMVHLGMTGRFERGPVPPPAARLALQFEGETVWFCDTRRFGCVVPLEEEGGLGEGLGPDALQPLDPEALAARFSGRTAIKVALLDQARLAGLGNIHAAEALWWSGVDPFCRCTDVAGAQWRALAVAIPEQLERALAQMPAAEAFVYLTEGGENPFMVYGREGEACSRCAGAISRAVQGGRSTFWCPRCQASDGT